ncbi:DEAD/DEAH box helicase [Corynebacterium sp. 153RC1]|uniref:DEAD/DEAH box helicase n=1 Tax=unclassified Corynebacterium TaxID=2624378 RepID=UPI00211BFE8B|nr:MULTISPECIES: DEAD/DEAH box helicase [unclassified Corynebacterium]MCQ9352459.1 DEAD/DEAH box helicase [Corynebacterium sp. 209RC1]MCQ9354369.1 DEAD/DEAH box helicase [Corynebacterium sp. 1222RC1]MCQ9356742.1 DEAD/DEAH box helicase [Corynebacterium sp. 122RC1]MCQ9358764.1 DEAD/DEAH box helicase [Corynebacterium sp. 142RC1]MCQ9361162.1 DEAD/DEAH box helicase [Corynebacterium sp. 153RC1]
MTTFADLGLAPAVVHVLQRQGITEPFPIQAAAIPDALAGKDVLGRGPTGSGKTFTFGLPIISRLFRTGASTPGKPRALILVPTRELAAQVRERLDEPAAVCGLRIIDVVGGVNIRNHIRQLAAPVDILVATPGRAQDLINQKYLDLSKVEITALDEADQMADMGFLPQVTKLLERTPAGGQRLLFSATLDGDVQKLVDRFMQEPAVHSTAPVEAAVETMTHYVFHVGQKADRPDIVARIAGREGKTIMFMRTKHAVDRQVKKLRRIGINAVGLHGDKGQGSRTASIAGFTDGSVPVLVATDIAARGIDIADVDLVVHIDPPAEHKAYLHRAGRTARAGAVGAVVTLVTDEQRQEVAKLLEKAGVDAQEAHVTADSEELARITGARKVNGSPLPPFGQMLQQRPSKDSDAPKTPGTRSRGSRRRTGGNKARNGNKARGESQNTSAQPFRERSGKGNAGRNAQPRSSRQRGNR